MRALLIALLCSPALAHDGHGASGPHLHGWDGAGPVLLAGAAGVLAWWLLKGRK